MIGNLPHELFVSTGLVALTVAIHLVGLDTLTSLTGLHLRWFTPAWARMNRLIVPLGIVIGLFVLHGFEIWLYAFAYIGIGALPDLEQALYFSTSAYSTAGEAGPLLPKHWRVLGALEAINGMLLIGWSTAFLFQNLARLMHHEGEHPLPAGAISRKRRRRSEERD